MVRDCFPLGVATCPPLEEGLQNFLAVALGRGGGDVSLKEKGETYAIAQLRQHMSEMAEKRESCLSLRHSHKHLSI